MTKLELSLKNGGTLVVMVDEMANGEVAVSHAIQVVSKSGVTSSVTCTCASTGKSVTKDCPGTDYLCDCTDPNNQSITCT
jgi:hypothetical protein